MTEANKSPKRKKAKNVKGSFAKHFNPDQAEKSEESEDEDESEKSEDSEDSESEGKTIFVTMSVQVLIYTCISFSHLCHHCVIFLLLQVSWTQRSVVQMMMILKGMTLTISSSMTNPMMMTTMVIINLLKKVANLQMTVMSRLTLAAVALLEVIVAVMLQPMTVKLTKDKC